MIDKNYLSDFKKSSIYSLIENGAEKRQLKEVLLGENEYAMSFLPISSSTDTSMIIIGLHLLVVESKITNLEINKTFHSIEITINNVCLLLSYIRHYLLYRKLESILEIDYQKLFQRIIKDEGQYKDLDCYKSLVSRVHKAMAEQNYE